MSIRWFISNETSSHTPQYGPSGDFALNSEGPFRLLGNAVAATVGFMFSSNPKLLTELDLYHLCQQQTWALSNTNSCKCILLQTHTPPNTYSRKQILLQTHTAANTNSRKHILLQKHTPPKNLLPQTHTPSGTYSLKHCEQLNCKKANLWKHQ